MMRLAIAMGIVCALVCAPRVEARGRHRQCRGDCPPIGLEYEFSFGVDQLSLARETFAGTITPLDGNGQPGRAETIAVTGRNVGAVHPQALVGEVHIFRMDIPHLALGIKLGILGGDFGKAVETTSGAVVDAHSAHGMSFAPEARVIFSRGPVELRGGVSAGWRELWLDVPNRFVHCKGGRCTASVSTDELFIEPRVSVAVNLPLVSIGGYAGGDIMPTGGWVAGGLVALRFAEWDKLGDWRAWSRRALYH
jgi:hypothetical protein